MDKNKKLEKLNQEYEDQFVCLESEEADAFIKKLGLMFAENDVAELYDKRYFQTPLFHGTDLRILKMSADGQKHIANQMIKLRDYLVTIYKKNDFERLQFNLPKMQEILGSAFEVNRFNTLYIKGSGGFLGNKQYDYEHFYVTNMLCRAQDYAEGANIFGEIGNVNYALLKHLPDFGYSLGEGAELFKDCIDYINKAALEKPQPAVLMYCFIPREKVLLDNGSEIFEFNGVDYLCKGGCSYRIKDSFNINKGSIIYTEKGYVLPELKDIIKGDMLFE